MGGSVGIVGVAVGRGVGGAVGATVGEGSGAEVGAIVSCSVSSAGEEVGCTGARLVVGDLDGVRVGEGGVGRSATGEGVG